MNAGHDTLVGVHASLAELIALRERGAGGTAHQVHGHAPPGAHLGGSRSRGMEYCEARPYLAGDDARGIDWRQTARRGKPYVKLFQEERERAVSVLIDLGPHMRFGTRVAFKSVQAARAAALLAWSAAAGGDRIGGIVWDGGAMQRLPPQGRERGALALLREMAEATARMPGTLLALPALSAPLRALADTLRHGGTAVVLSDFSALDAAAERDIAALAARTDVLLVHVYDVFEAEPPAGVYRLTDGRASMTLDLRSADARTRYAAPFTARCDALERLARQPNVRLLPLATHDDPGLLAQLLAAPPHARYAA
jgi:uncharacterized protein (DUF58 family)